MESREGELACDFCETLKCKYLTDTKFHEQYPHIRYEYEAALVSVTYKMPNMREGGTLTSYGYKLRFCPECGANIRKRLRKWKNEMRDQSRI